ncbi:hypothetical protein [Thalassobacillus sp. CUG 92003]|uniref:hypothetical protein n=1 Tax=Thalassobacillus sp. CUG 92003 TaxID=2736641 RepID=UPI0015E7D25D|nr:hypothetical protein [Thalassobacillus sp. CUG 92003]
MKPRILLISDNLPETNSLQRTLSDHNVYVQCDNIDGSDIRHIIANQHINLILLDDSCFSMLGYLNSVARETGVILILHRHDDELIKTSMNYNVKGFLLKPLYPGLMSTIHHALQGANDNH